MAARETNTLVESGCDLMAASESELKLEVKPKKGVFYACMLLSVCNNK